MRLSLISLQLRQSESNACCPSHASTYELGCSWLCVLHNLHIPRRISIVTLSISYITVPNLVRIGDNCVRVDLTRRKPGRGRFGREQFQDHPIHARLHEYLPKFHARMPKNNGPQIVRTMPLSWWRKWLRMTGRYMCVNVRWLEQTLQPFSSTDEMLARRCTTYAPL
jgi:hypothetical protein